MTILELFADAVARFPERRAVTFQGASLTYAELDRRVDALARGLVCRGVRPGDVVAVRLAPSLDTMIALLGALRAGACYLPIDADAPDDRVRYLLDDSGARVLIDRIPDDDLAAPLPAVGEGDAAYLIYTSGTTGKPKGVVVEHGALANYVSWFRDRYGIDESHTAVVLTSYAFDLAYTTLWTTIASGGELHFLKAFEDAGAVARYIGEHGISFVKVTPSLLSALVRSHAFDRVHCGCLRLIVTGGERVRGADVETVYARLPDVLVVNHYGPTETTIGVTTHPLPRGAVGERSIIGRPIGNVTAHVVTPDLAPVPPGEVGELLIGGRAVARGYHRRAQLTQERFIPDPFAPGGRLYRTGDLARWLPDGTLELLGRSDRQLKIRGYRIEPGEIEHVMQRRFGLAEVVVLEHQQALCAYYVGDAPADMRASLGEVLPDYMVPTHLVPLASLPRTANGKLDAAALPAPQVVTAAVGEGEQPRSDTERVLARLWSDVLGIEPAAIGMSQSFFELGGHSLLMIQLIAEIDNHFGRTVEIPAFYREGTIRALARMLEP